ncbi:hypothetical protein MMC07_001717 [Pseudocyphellaria aurata]|nr:hypothetical protein [Pseudocyphellaria aurata]
MVCLYPSCDNCKWPNEVSLLLHMETHFATDSATRSVSLPPSHSIRSDQGSQHWQQSQGYQPAYGSSTTTTNDNHLSFVHWKPLIHADSESSPSTPLAKRYACSHEGCSSSFNRKGDLNRHRKIHEDGPRRYDCFDDKCKRTGNNGFTRLDKLKVHVARRHPLSDVHIYTKSKTHDRWDFEIGRFRSWREARRRWQTEHPSDELPPWLKESSDPRVCPKCNGLYATMDGLRAHWQITHSPVEMPLWMTQELPDWFWVVASLK